MVDKAIMVEHARKEMGEQKRKYESRRESTSHRRSPAAMHVLDSTPRKEHLSAQEDKMSTLGKASTSVSTNRVNSSHKLSTQVSQCSAPTFSRIARAPLRAHR
jgi:hypothetical protein